MSYVGVGSGTEWGPDREIRRDVATSRGTASSAARHATARHATGRHRTGHGRASQTSAAYWAIVRSLENFPELATFRMAVRVQASGRA
jgi:hypothetical protein